jgi:hypothetical protein
MPQSPSGSERKSNGRAAGHPGSKGPARPPVQRAPTKRVCLTIPPAGSILRTCQSRREQAPGKQPDPNDRAGHMEKLWLCNWKNTDHLLDYLVGGQMRRTVTGRQAPRPCYLTCLLSGANQTWSGGILRWFSMAAGLSAFATGFRLRG